METSQTVSILKYWPVIVGVGAFICAIFIAVRYRIPDLASKVKVMENEKANAKDLKTALDSFHTVCKFNQVSCQKATSAEIQKVKNEVEKALSQMNAVLSQQAVLMARIDERLEALASQNIKGPALNQINLPCQSGHQCPLNPDEITIQQEKS